jgi:lipoate-protein ligase A
MGGMSELWLVMDSGLCGATWNMALDEALLLGATESGRPVLRFYGWNEPAATFGYFQHYSDIERWTLLRPLLRRPTGGGLVPHQADWTYSVAIPPQHPWYRLQAVLSYQRLHEWIRSSMALLNIASELCPETRKEIPGQCFAGAEKYDLLWRGRKMAGAAQRRTKNGLLIQGSVQPQPPGITRAVWQKAMCEAATRDFQAQWELVTPSPSQVHCAEELAAEKYALDEYNKRR